mgnify:CR=1 FL=1
MDVFKEWWGAFMALIGLGVWLVRLEGSSKSALREILRLEKRFEDERMRIYKQMESDRQATTASRQETSDMLREMRSDIKRLLERNRA